MRISVDSRLFALSLLLPSMALASVMLVLGYGSFFVASIVGLCFLLAFLRLPEIPITIVYPLIWLFWSYYTPWLGGRLERAVGALAIVGVLISVLIYRRKPASLPSVIMVGMTMLFGTYLLSSVFNSTPNPVQNLISLATRLLFLFLAFYLLSEPRHLRQVGGLLIITGMMGAGIIFYWNVIWGWGFFRTYQGNLLAVSSLGPFWYTLLMGGNSLTIPAVMLIGLSPALKSRTQRTLAFLGAVFLFAMAFASQFRREILISAFLVLIYLIVTNFSGSRKPATWVLLGLGIFYFLVLQPSDIFQARISELSNVTAGTDTRLISLRAGLDAIVKSPLWGTGPASYESTAFRVLGAGYPSVYYHAYNVFIYFAVEAGVLGLAGLLLILYGVFSAVMKRGADPDTPQGWIISSAPALMIVILVSFTFGNYYEMSLPWFLMGMILAAIRLRKSPVLESGK